MLALYSYRIIFLTIFIFLTYICNQSHAISILGNVGSATVENGKLTFETRLGYESNVDSPFSTNQYNTRQQIDLGVTNWLALRGFVDQKKVDGQSWEQTSSGIEARLQWFKSTGFQSGGRIRYSFHNNRTDDLELRLANQIKLWNFEFRNNILAEQEIGEDTKYHTRNRLTFEFGSYKKSIKSIKFGIESFYLFNEELDNGTKVDLHYIGPIINVKLKNNFFLRSVTKFGVTDNSDQFIINFTLGKKF